MLCIIASIASLLFFSKNFLLQQLEEKIFITEIGIIPSITIYFKDKPLDKSMANKLTNDILKFADFKNIRKGFLKKEAKTFFSWDKLEPVATSLFVEWIGWDMDYEISLDVNNKDTNVTVPCLRVSQVHGFFIPMSKAKNLHDNITVKKVIIESEIPHDIEFNMPVKWSGKTKVVKNIEYKIYTIATPSLNYSEKDREKYSKLRDKYITKINYCLSASLGEKIWNTLEKTSKNNISRLYNGRSACIPSSQFLDDLCGTSGLKATRYKNLLLNNTISLELFGYFRNRYNEENNGYKLYCNLSWLMEYLGNNIKQYNLLELDIINDIKSGNKLEILRNKIRNYLNKNFSNYKTDIVLWNEMADKQHVDFIRFIINGINVFSLIIISFIILTFIQIGGRFVKEIKKDWEIIYITGGTTWQYSLLWIIYMVLISLSMIISFKFINVFYSKIF